MGNTEVLAVKHAVGPPIPEFPQGTEDEREILASVAGKQTIDVLDKNPAGSELANDAMELPPQSGLLSSQSATASRHADVGAGESTADEVDRGKVVSSALTDIAMPFDVGPVRGEDTPALSVDLDLPGTAPAGALKPEVEAADASEERAERGTVIAHR